MQNRYTGDIGDFSKLGLLRTLHSAGLSIGLNWYLTPDETHNSDGRHVGYLRRDGFPGASGLALKFEKVSQRYYMFLIQPRHKEAVEKALKDMLSTAWGDHFRLL